MLVSTFSSDAVSIADRERLWNEELRRFGVTTRPASEGAPVFASLVCRVSGAGMRFGRVATCAQELCFALDRGAGFWFLRLLEGQASLAGGEAPVDLHEGQIAYGMLGDRTRVNLRSDCRVLLIRAPEILLSPRLLVPLSLKSGRLVGKSGSRHILASMLTAVAEKIATLSDDDLGALELALPEFMLVNLLDSVEKADGAESGARLTAPLLRVCQAIEANLADPDLDLAKVAAQQGVSERSDRKSTRLNSSH